MLARFCTDICAVQGWPRLLRLVPGRWLPRAARRLRGRVPQGVPVPKIRAFPAFGWQYARRCAAARTSTDRTAAYLWGAKRFCALVLGQGWGAGDGVYTFNSAGLELLCQARSRGMRAVMEQTIAPRALEARLSAEERALFPGWEGPQNADGMLEEFSAREQAEWGQSELILCGSEFVKEGVAACGVPADRCAVVPYGVDDRFTVPERPRHGGPLRVLTVGEVGLRKGSPYVMRAAERLRGRAIFRMVGPVKVTGAAEQELRRRVEVVGQVPRAEILAQYAWADVFLLPSVCEGSAVATYEALSCGLPVVTTPNTGSVVRDQVDGFLVPVRDYAAVADRLEALAERPDLCREMGRRAKERAGEFTLAAYGTRLLAALGGQHGAPGTPYG